MNGAVVEIDPATCGIGQAGKGLSACRVLAELPAHIITLLENNCNWFRFPPRTVVLEQNTPSDAVYFVIEGTLRVFFRAHANQEVNLAELRAGDVFGELAAIDGGGRSADVATIGDTILAVLPSDRFQEALSRYPELALRFLRRAAAIIRRADSQIMRLSALTGIQRIYMELLRLAAPSSDNDGSWVIAPIPLHREIAAWAGTSDSDVVRALSHLIKSSILVRQRQHLQIRDRRRLESLAMADSVDMYSYFRMGKAVEVDAMKA